MPLYPAPLFQESQILSPSVGDSWLGSGFTQRAEEMRLAEQNSASGAGWKGDPGLGGGGGCGFSFCLRAKAKVEEVCGRGPEHWGSAGWSLGVLAPGVCVCVGPALGGSGWWLVWLQKAREQMWVSLSSFCITHCIKMAFARDYLVGFVPSCLGGLSFKIWGSEGTQVYWDLESEAPDLGRWKFSTPSISLSNLWGF